MSQSEISDFVKKYPNDWLTSKQIAEGIGKRHTTVIMSLAKLRKWRLINCKEGNGKEFRFLLYQYKYIKQD